MEILGRSGDLDLGVEDAAQGVAQRGLVGGEHGGVAHQDHVGVQLLPAFAQEDGQALAPGLLLALDHDLEVDGELAVDLHVGLDRLEVHVDLSLVVHGAARVELAVAHNGLEGLRGPQLERLGRLNVVVPVEQRGRLAGGAQPLSVDDGVARGLHHLHARHSELSQLGREVLGAAQHVGLVLGLGADARDAERGLQVFDEAVLVLLEVLGKGIHGRSPRVGVTFESGQI